MRSTVAARWGALLAGTALAATALAVGGCSDDGDASPATTVPATVPPDASVQYHFAVAASGAPTIGIWRGEPVKGNGVARNQPGKTYVDHVCGAGTFTITIWGITGPATVSVSANSWWRKVFGWG